MAKLEETLLKSGFIDEAQWKRVSEEMKKGNEPLAQILFRLGYIDSKDAYKKFLVKQLNVGALQLSDIRLDEKILELVPEEMVRKHHILPLFEIDGTLYVVVGDDASSAIMSSIEFLTGLNVSFIKEEEGVVVEQIENYYSEEVSLSGLVDDVETEDDDMEIMESVEDDANAESLLMAEIKDSPVVKLVDGIINEAVKTGTSDIHIEPFRTKIKVRMRIDGQLFERLVLPGDLRRPLISRLKIMSKLDVSETRIPQDGQISIRYQKRKIDFRVSTLPTIYGEKIVLRLLDPANLRLNLRDLGFPEEGLTKFTKAISLPFGMVLVTGPTGSGKTTTLYSALATLNDEHTNIMTAEDPVEYNLRGINQVQMDSAIDFTFASALRSFLRMDPDVILVGEIRDYETAEIAIKAALTGHLVFSTLHTNNTSATINRLIDMGVEPFLVSASVKLIMAQRLLKKNCTHCKAPYEPTEYELQRMQLSEEDVKDITFYEGKGCDNCNGTGYSGRLAVFEIMLIDRDMEKLIQEGASALELAKISMSKAMRTLRMEAIMKAKEGIVSVEQVLIESEDAISSVGS